MDCPQVEWSADPTHAERFRQVVARHRLPVSGSLELTRGCNLRCRHCYLGADDERLPADRAELDTAAWLGILDQIVAAGCLYLLITGGEPLVRPDFAEIYSHAKRRGMLVTLFTNGTLLDESVLDVLTDLPPQTVEITLYGATAATYEAITGVPGSFDRCRAGLERLAQRRLRFRLKTVLTRLNIDELEAMEALARRFGVKFRFDPAIFPTFGGDRAPLDLRVDPAVVADRELADEERRREWTEFYRRHHEPPATDDAFSCGTGVGTFHVDPFGRLCPCVMVRRPAYDLTRGDFATGWREVIPTVRKLKMAAGQKCRTCRDISLCGYCPAFFELENGSPDIPSEYLCTLGQNRADRIRSIINTEA
ncbi:MAG TPA: radical SAM protein [Acidobacteriota bacterium]|nr:radical SAM protein [Acidobacteriota bacterium]HQF85790.1 radical SAM protein [Acidobacteriota bacterium]HQG90966.1 radical SAM protein [Acidobacteriota bacterium]HQK88564.1 radical SAM protein [Acidobacteriota bacterium]